MIPYEYRVLGRYLTTHKRLVSLASMYPYGTTEIDDEHLLEKLDRYLGAFREHHIVNNFERFKSTIPFPVLEDAEFNERMPPDDVLLKDVHRQHYSIEERFRKNQIPLDSIKMLVDPSTRIHMSFARGSERELIKYFNKLDTESINRKYYNDLIL